MNDAPMISANVIVREAASAVSISICIDRPINGFYGCLFSPVPDFLFDIENKADRNKLEAFAKEKLLWKVQRETGLTVDENNAPIWKPEQFNVSFEYCKLDPMPVEEDLPEPKPAQEEILVPVGADVVKDLMETPQKAKKEKTSKQKK